MKKIIQNISRSYQVFNLDPPDKSGNLQSLHLALKEKSRPLTEEEFQSIEIQKCIKQGELTGQRVIKYFDALETPEQNESD